MTVHNRILILSVAFFLVACQGAWTDYPQTADVPPLSYDMMTGDSVTVTILGEDDISGDYHIDAAGFITMPLIGRVYATGQTGESLAVVIADALKSGGYLVAPDVRVDGLQARNIAVMGEVMQAGDYPWNASMTVLDAVARAGGFTYRANQTAFDIVRKNADGEQSVIKADLATRVQGGDVIRIRERFF